MEEWVGARWHRFIWQAADSSFPKAAVRLEDVQRAVQMLFRAGGGDALVRVVPATAQKIGGPRNWLQKVAGQGERAALSTLDEQTLALPPLIAVFPDAALNRDLYLWLAAQAACHHATPAGWLADNVAATQRALVRFPGLRARYARLAQAHLAQRGAPAKLRGSARDQEQRVQEALQALPESEASPWIVQFFMNDDRNIDGLNQVLRDYIAEQHKNYPQRAQAIMESPYTQAVLAEAHRRFISIEALQEANAADLPARDKLKKVIEGMVEAVAGQQGWHTRVLGRELMSPSSHLQVLQQNEVFPKFRVIVGILSEAHAIKRYSDEVSRRNRELTGE